MARSYFYTVNDDPDAAAYVAYVNSQIPAERQRSRHKQAIPADVRREVVARFGAKYGETVKAKCAYCDTVGTIYIFPQGKKGWPAILDLEYDHIHPEFLGGKTTAENLVLACRPCNRAKGPRTPEQWRRDRGQNPRN